jgi:hypothetical protein
MEEAQDTAMVGRRVDLGRGRLWCLSSRATDSQLFVRMLLDGVRWEQHSRLKIAMCCVVLEPRAIFLLLFVCRP